MDSRFRIRFDIVKTIYNSERKFVIFSYDASHGVLLLRSAKTTSSDTRCDVVFSDVRAMELRISSDGITISEVELAHLETFKSSPLDLMEEGLVAYKVGNDTWSGFVLGGIVTTAEDYEDFFERSPLLPT